MDALAATSPVAVELPASPSQSDAALPHREDSHPANAAPLIGVEPHSQAVNAPVPNERSTARASSVSDDEHRMSPVLENQDKAQKNVLLKILGLLISLLGYGLVFISSLLFVVSIGAGADITGIIIILSAFLIGIVLLILGNRIMKRF
jgi:hypothetical protein